jgi:hypothetical protein
MIYFPDITGRGGWADTLLGLLVSCFMFSSLRNMTIASGLRQQSRTPPLPDSHGICPGADLQSSWSAELTNALQATSEIQLEGTVVIPTPLFQVLDGQVVKKLFVVVFFGF